MKRVRWRKGRSCCLKWGKGKVNGDNHESEIRLMIEGAMRWGDWGDCDD